MGRIHVGRGDTRQVPGAMRQPEEHERELLWRSMIPAKAGVADDVAYNELARMFVMSGGYIKNAVLRAAFMCAELSCPINNEQLWHAARREYEGMGMLAHVEC